jgi:hypothetical protein
MYIICSCWPVNQDEEIVVPLPKLLSSNLCYLLLLLVLHRIDSTSIPYLCVSSLGIATSITVPSPKSKGPVVEFILSIHSAYFAVDFVTA